MNKLKQYLTNIDFTYKKVVIFALLTAFYTAIVNLIPVLDNTSIQDIAIYPDLWFIFAIIIIINSKSYKDASIKTFLFFLISQPLIYLIESFFDAEGLGIFRYYGYWFKITMLTIPGASIAYLVKKKNYLSILVLAIATGYLAYSSIVFLRTAIYNFPYHLLSSITSLLLSLFLIYLIFEDNKQRLISLLIVIIVIITSCLFLKPFKKNTYIINLDKNNYHYVLDNEELIDVSINENELIINTKNKTGNAYIGIYEGDNLVHEYYVSVSTGDIWVDQLN